ncbi:bifunctional hydroxymethylpyrimidine kinase/phosphomethylpyrimidine kinase [Bacillus aquiflavi]|uniref:Hydroxymethylpyrimidine/phosphomethylpyrimidine kinase n=1 Tax=Bacillus aquiflavi TaxID=2672567 RepID=A0A6B3VZG5_9BACI|nr:bifunctional hydroxymethylpyrimidine kinase/phosphomethylpyrimidine kinase [Bacillus aquiflavi]MBA4536776.1 bifunctional hydroxymethylpyrimidine kinase/phosphomethylpyrimidine kinase [Bacillus aquiflavi]NEY81143.1 bifunctional hydroxymethylpyrimidine kinase/phosphomethylpyrimidine kinase [Bacillus aquiflavi]UAC49704.1 bifunctional hydroxymethylpyrimidine kinase/phosphomethylpyrimidine kinase [Bacillus aquiflavi]
MKTALTIAGSDSSGGAGIQADLKTFSAHGVYGMSVITAITAQNTLGVRSVQNIDLAIIRDQIDAIFEDIDVHSVKIGMLSNSEIIKTVAERLTYYKPNEIVLDPVMVSKSGSDLLQEEAVASLVQYLLPIATVITPNLPEAEKLTGKAISTVEEMRQACKDLKKSGVQYVLIKGGHLKGKPIDLLYDGNEFLSFEAERIETKNTHGTGCTLSSAIASNLALGMNIHNAVQQAKEYITTAIKHSLSIGNGHGPTHHFYQLYKKAKIHD